MPFRIERHTRMRLQIETLAFLLVSFLFIREPQTSSGADHSSRLAKWSGQKRRRRQFISAGQTRADLHQQPVVNKCLAEKF